MGRRRNEEPEWDSTDDGSEGSDGSSVQESAFSDEDSESGSEGSQTGSEGSGDYSETGSEGSEDYSESEDSDSQSESSEDSDESSDESDSGLDESMESIDYDDEQGIMGKDRGSMGSLYNNPTAKPRWAKFVPSKIMDKGQSAALVFCLCIILIPLSLIIGLSVGLTRGKDEPEPTAAPTKAPTVPPTAPPTAAAEVIRAAVLSSEATNTIYRSGILGDVTNGEEETILVQNGPPGDAELPSAYSLVQFDGIVGVDGDSASVDEYLGSIEGLMVEFCLTVADEEVSGKKTYTTCLLPPESVPSSLDGLSGETAPSYSIPADCLNEKTVDFEVDTTSEQVCINVEPLLTSGMDTINTGPENPKLRGRRQLEKETGVNVTYLFMIDTLEESDQAGTKFYSSKASEDVAPSLSIEGENTCKSAAQIACRRPEFKELCNLGKQGGLENILDSNQQLASKTVFAPLNTAFDSLSKGTKKALGDTSTLIKTLQYHVAEKKIMSTDLECNAETNMIVGSTTTLCGSNGQFYQVGTGVSPGVNSLPKIVAADIETCYGVMHVVDQVLIPADPKATCISAEANQTVADLCEQPEYTMMCSMIKTAGLADVLSTGLYTIFAPTDEAFNDALQALGASVNFTDTGLVTDVVLGHAISGSAIYAKDLECDTEVEMANGQKNKITCDGDMFFIGGSGNDITSPPEIVEKDALACNLVVHRVNKVILPSLGGDNVGDDDEVFPSCGICGAGLVVTLSDETIEIPDSVGLPAQSGGVTCGMADKFCRSGACSPETCTAFADGISGACGCKESPTVVDVLAGEDSLSSVYSLVESAGLVGTLGDPQEEITIFAPENGGFKTLEETSPGFIAKLQESGDLWKTHLTDFLLHHTVGEIYASSDLKDLTKVNALNGEKLTLRTNQNKKVFVNEARIEVADLTGDNGVVHAIEDVLLPAWVDTTVVDILGAKSKLSAVNDFLRQANLADALSGEGPFTVFAPTNNAIQQALQAFAGIGLDDSNTIALILNYHVVSGIYPASALSDGLSLTTLSKEDLIFSVVDNTVMVNGNKISSTDILAKNGIVHVIDGFLMPPALAPGGGGEMQPDGAATQSCSICSGEFGEFTLANPDSIITLPDGINISTIESSEVTCSLLEQACQIGVCDAKTCQTLASQDTKDTCGCSE